MNSEEKLKFFNENVNKIILVKDNSQWVETKLTGISMSNDDCFIDEDGDFFTPEQIKAKPEPKIKLWTAETCPDNLMIRAKGASPGVAWNVNISIDYIWYLDISGTSHKITWDELANDYIQRDGSPCHDWEE